MNENFYVRVKADNVTVVIVFRPEPLWQL